MKVAMICISIALALTAYVFAHEKVVICKDLNHKAYLINKTYVKLFADMCTGEPAHCLQATIRLQRDLNESSDRVLTEAGCDWTRRYW